MTVRPVIVGNWKMNGRKAEALLQIDHLLAGLEPLTAYAQVVICPPMTLLDRFAERMSSDLIWVGAQDCLADDCGAHTGDVNAEMVSDIGARVVILGHSERRQRHNESDSLIRRKVESAWAAGLTAVVCVGESRADREHGRALEVVLAQLAASLPEGVHGQNTIIAYEPVWAIGSGTLPSAAELSPIYAGIRAHLHGRFGADVRIRVLYGGSVTRENAGRLMHGIHADGLIVGKASLTAEEFIAIVKACVG